MALKVSESAKLAYYTVIPKELEAFWALQGALEPRGGQIGPPDGAHMQVRWPLGPSKAPKAMASVAILAQVILAQAISARGEATV